MPAVDQHGQPYGPGPTEITERVQRGAHRTPGVEHVVDQDHHGVVDLDRHLGAAHHAGRLPTEVVAVHGHVQRADRDVGAFDLGHRGGQPSGEHDPSGRDAQQDQSAGAAVGLEDLVGHPGAGPGDLIGVQDQSAGVGGRISEATVERTALRHRLSSSACLTNQGPDFGAKLWG